MTPLAPLASSVAPVPRVPLGKMPTTTKATKKRQRSSDDDATTKRQYSAEDDGGYAAWLRSRGARWEEGSVLLTTKGSVAGWGYVAQKKLRKGEAIFRVPREACLGARRPRVGDESPQEDTQARHLHARFVSRDCRIVLSTPSVEAFSKSVLHLAAAVRALQFRLRL